MNLRLLYIFSVCLLLSSCHNDLVDADNTETNTTQITVPYEFDEITGDLIGYVHDQNDSPLSNAEVTIYNSSTTTNEHGVFQFNSAGLDAQGTTIRISKPGYKTAFDLVYPSADAVCISSILLSTFNSSISFESNLGGNLPIENGGQTTFNANTVTFANGADYNGNVNVDAHYISPSNTKHNLLMKGGFQGVAQDNSNKALASFGMVNIDLQSDSEDPLFLKPERTLSISFPIQPDALATAPEEVALYHYDEEKQIWVESGTAMRVEGQYVATVDQVGSWMIAQSYGLSQFCSRLTTNNTDIASNINYRIMHGNQICGVGISDEKGFVCSKLPKGRALVLEILHPICDRIIDQINIGPFEDIAGPEDIRINLEESFQVGQTICDGNPSANAIVVVKKQNLTTLLKSDENGQFGINLASILCDQTGEYELFAISEDLTSSILYLDENISENLKIDICNPACDFSASFELAKINYCESGVYDVATVLVEGGSGNFGFSWDNGGTGVSNSSLVLGQDLCLTITDLADNCSYFYCEEITEYEALNIRSSESGNNNCQQNGGFINSEISGGEMPYAINWTGVNGFSSDQLNIEDLLPGEYELNVTDIHGCMVSESFEIFDVTENLVYTVTNQCIESVITITENDGYGPYTYEWSNGGSTGNTLTIIEPGEYGFTVTDSNGCKRSGSVNPSIVGEDLSINTSYTCEREIMQFETINEDYTYFYIPELSSDKTLLSNNNVNATLSIIETGYNFEFGALDNESGCEISQHVYLPAFEGLSIESVANTSCEECEDGRIIIIVNEQADCSDGCIPGEVIVINRENGNEITDLNNEGQLPKGLYIVAVLSQSSGCFIAHEEVEIE